MHRRTMLKRLAAGAGTFAGLVGTTTARTNSRLEDLRGTDYHYRVTENGLEKVVTTGDFDITDHCNVGHCCECPDHCEGYCGCLTPC